MKKHGLNVARGLIALVLLAAGGAKLAGVPEVHGSFQILGLPEWFGYFIGACEVASAIGLFISPLSALAAIGISVIMGGAVYFHIVHTPLVQGIPALVVLALSIFVFTKTRAKMLKFSKV